MTSDLSGATTEFSRDELIGVARSVMSALERRDASSVPFAPDAVITENTHVRGPGDIELFSYLTAFRHPMQFVADLQTGEIGVQAVIDDAAGEAVLAFRLKVAGGLITEFEILIAHDGESGPAFQPVGFLIRESPYIVAIPAPVRTSRDDLSRIANNFWAVATTSHDRRQVEFSPTAYH